MCPLLNLNDNACKQNHMWFILISTRWWDQCWVNFQSLDDKLKLIFRWIVTYILNDWFIVNCYWSCPLIFILDYWYQSLKEAAGLMPGHAGSPCKGDALTPSCWDPVGLLFTLSFMGNGFHWGCVSYSAKSYTHTVIPQPLTAACDDG